MNVKSKERSFKAIKFLELLRQARGLERTRTMQETGTLVGLVIGLAGEK